MAVHRKSNRVGILSESGISLWSLAEGDPTCLGSKLGLIGSRCAFINDAFLAIILGNRICSLDLATFDLSENNLAFPESVDPVFFRRIGRFLFLMSADGIILYITLDLKRYITKQIPHRIKMVQMSKESLFALDGDGRIIMIHQNDIEFLEVPKCSCFAISRDGDSIMIKTNSSEWELWCLKPNSRISKLRVSAQQGLWSPNCKSCLLFGEDSIYVTYYGAVIQEENTRIKKAVFDSFGQSLIGTNESGIGVLKFATSLSICSSVASAPITSKEVLLPFRDMLCSVALPAGKRGTISLFGEMGLAVGTTQSVCILQFREKVCHTAGDGSAHSQFMTNSNQLQQTTEWIVIDKVNVKDMVWYGSKLIVLSFNNHSYYIIMISKGRIKRAIKLKRKPLSLSLSGNRMLIAYPSELSCRAVDKDFCEVWVKGFSDIVIKRARFINSETFAIQTSDRRLLLVAHFQIISVITDVLGWQSTANSAWPLILYGERWRLLSANNSELVLAIPSGLLLGIEGLSVLSICPLATFEFAHLVVIQAISGDSLASAISILFQAPENERLEILTKVGCTLASTNFEIFLGLLDRFKDIQDQVLQRVISRTDVNFEKRRLWQLCCQQGLYETAGELLDEVNLEEWINLLIKSQFNIHLVITISKRNTSIFNPSDLINSSENEMILNFQNALTAFVRDLFLKNDYLLITQFIPYLESWIRRYLLTRRRKTEENLSSIIRAMEKCTKQNLVQLSRIIEDVGAFDLLFCCSYVLRDLPRCVECIERRHEVLANVEETIKNSICHFFREKDCYKNA